MKNALLLLTFLAVSIISVNAQSGLLKGNWVNTDPNTGGVTRVNIGDNKVQMWGQCHPTDCDWGSQNIRRYENRAQADRPMLTARFDGSINRLTVMRMLSNNKLQVEVFTDFADGRSDYYSVQTFNRSMILVPPPVIHLTAPILVSPNEGAVFNNFPRNMTFVWKPVSGAVKYQVEIDYYYGGKWASEINGPFYKESTTNSLSHVFVGAQPGRFRVAAVNALGVVGPRSEWRTFRFTR